MLVACVGDDFVYAPAHVERLAVLQALHGGAISWHGWAIDGRSLPFRAHAAEATPLIRCGTALMIARAADLLGIAGHELADLFFHPRGHDEALVSCWLWDYDRKTVLRRVLRQRYGWPDPPRRADPRQVAAVRRELNALLAGGA
jgi:hypothetical protein